MEPRESATAARADVLLSVEGVCVRFGGVTALDGVSFTVGRGQICGLIGPNGAGKTTLFNVISRLYEPTAGDIALEGRPLSRIPRHAIAKAGVARTFQNLALFASMSVRENVRVGAHARVRAGFLSAALATPGSRAAEREIADLADRLIEECGLAGVAERLVGELPFGIKKRVELARALAMAPKLLLLDEPAAGLNHEEVDALAGEIVRLRDVRGLSVLLVEHHMNLVMRVSDQVVALNFGRLIADGTPAQVRTNADVIVAYLGQAA